MFGGIPVAGHPSDRVILSEMMRILMFVPLAAAVCALVAYGVWENHHQQRAVEKLPAVISLLDQVQPFPGSVRIGHEQGEQASAHEFAAAVVWRKYVSGAPCPDVRAHFEDQANELRFRYRSNDSYGTNTAFTFRNGEYEFRFILEPRSGHGCDISISTNWYGFER